VRAVKSHYSGGRNRIQSADWATLKMREDETEEGEAEGGTSELTEAQRVIRLVTQMETAAEGEATEAACSALLQLQLTSVFSQAPLVLGLRNTSIK